MQFQYIETIVVYGMKEAIFLYLLIFSPYPPLYLSFY